MNLMGMIWYGVIELKPLPENKVIPDGYIGAFVNVVAEADSEEDFLGICEDEFLELKFKVIGADQITYNKTIEDFSFPDDDVITENIQNCFDKQRFVYGTFYNYMAEGEA